MLLENGVVIIITVFEMIQIKYMCQTVETSEAAKCNEQEREEYSNPRHVVVEMVDQYQLSYC